MEDRQELENLIPHPIGHDEGCAGYYELPGIRHPTGPPHLRKMGEPLHSLLHTLQHSACGHRPILCDEVSDVLQVAKGTAGPPNPHPATF